MTWLWFTLGYCLMGVIVGGIMAAASLEAKCFDYMQVKDSGDASFTRAVAGLFWPLFILFLAMTVVSNIVGWAIREVKNPNTNV